MKFAALKALKKTQKRLSKEKKIYKASRENLKKLSSAREKQLSLNRSMELKNRILGRKVRRRGRFV
jgi:hypothetical protein